MRHPDKPNQNCQVASDVCDLSLHGHTRPLLHLGQSIVAHSFSCGVEKDQLGLTGGGRGDEGGTPGLLASISIPRLAVLGSREPGSGELDVVVISILRSPGKWFS